MAHVTKFNESRIIEKLTKDKIEINKKIKWKSIYERKPIPYLNSLELTQLYQYKQFCKGDINVDTIYQKAEIIDRKKYIYEGSKPSYHSTDECPYLHSNFKNVELPEDVKKWSGEDIEKFRNWFKRNINLEDENEKIIAQIKERWEIDCFIKRVNFRNSGSIYKEILTPKIIESRVDSLIESQRRFYKNNSYYLARFSKKTFLAFKAKPIEDNDTGLSDEVLKKKLKHFHNLYKEPIIYYLKEYYKLKFSRDITFEEDMLKALNFTACKSCYDGKTDQAIHKPIDRSKKTQLDIFLENRSAKKVCRIPSELVANVCEANKEYFEFYYFCKVMALHDYVEINSKSYREVIIEYIFNDNISYEKAYYLSDSNHGEEIEVFRGYLVYTSFKNNNHKGLWREVFFFDHEEESNFY
jgi:hypothetical protein